MSFSTNDLQDMGMRLVYVAAQLNSLEARQAELENRTDSETTEKTKEILQNAKQLISQLSALCTIYSEKISQLLTRTK